MCTEEPRSNKLRHVLELPEAPGLSFLRLLLGPALHLFLLGLLFLLLEGGLDGAKLEELLLLRTLLPAGQTLLLLEAGRRQEEEGDFLKDFNSHSKTSNTTAPKANL